MNNLMPHILSLPSIPLSDAKHLPQCKGIYFILSGENKLLYIGKSSNLYGRFINHHRKKMIYKSKGSIFYIQMDDESDIDELEGTLIDIFNPEWNGCKIPDEYAITDRKAISITTIYAPADIKTRIKESADENRRSLNAEIVHAIEEYLKSQSTSSRQKTP